MVEHAIVQVGFWISGMLLGYAFAGYPVVAQLLAMFRSRPSRLQQGDAPLPSVTVVIVARNEASRIANRIDNLRTVDYPPELLKVLVVSDGSEDETSRLVRAKGDERVGLIELEQGRGKAAGINTAMATVETEIVVFADARQRFAPDAIRQLVKHFADDAVGAVSGSLEIEKSVSGIGQGVDTYWKLEKALRTAEAKFDSCIGCTGAIYGIRTVAFTPIPEDTLLDDVVIPMQIAMKGLRVIHEAAAIAFDPQRLEPTAEKRRKRRTLTGNFQMLFRYPEWLLPWENRLWWQLISHKYLRLAAPALLVVCLVSSGILAHALFYRACFLVQCGLYLMALTGWMLPRVPIKIFALASGFVFLNAMTVRAFWHYLTSRGSHRWN
jgi:cellulose synthase/poly-beta-1,6-N-acetylglucosamine synthase-like glycosyltransferase